MSPRSAACALALLAALPACSTDDETEHERFERLTRDAERLRGLALMHEVPIRRLSQEEFAARGAADASAIDDEELELYRQTWGRLGFFDVDLDLRADIAERNATAAGIYDPAERSILLVGDVPDNVIVHELVHAIQDQHFGLEAYIDAASSDERLARRSVAEGDATLVQYGHFFESEYGTSLGDSPWAGLFPNLRDRSEEILDDANVPLLHANRSFVYFYGLEYAIRTVIGPSEDEPYAVYTELNWEGENALYGSAAPASTEEVLALGEREPIHDFGIRALPGWLSPDLEGLGWSTLGKWHTYLLLRPLTDHPLSEPSPRDLAESWAGDRVLFVRNTVTGDVGTLWASAWDSVSAADDAAPRLWDLYDVSTHDGSTGLGDDGEPVYVEQRGALVVATKNLDHELAARAADVLFDGAELDLDEVDTAPMRLDWTRQWLGLGGRCLASGVSVPFR